jgi:hypothetical protein
MKWFLIVWTVGGLWLFYTFLTADAKGDGFFGSEFYRLGQTVLSLPFFFGTGFGLFQVVSGVFEKLRKVQP